ncbi:Non-catalytic module family EXPN [Melampsora americana]|nr:Non-catalytic module family EXPN [Melampsora americana]
MLDSITSISSLLLLSLFPLTSIASHLQLANNHHHRSTLTKRGAGGGTYHGRATFYATGLGSCGDTNTDSDYIVALNQAQYDSSWCGKTITISYGGKSCQAVVKDLCPGCPMGGLDMSPGLFKYFASEDVGVFYMTWSVGGGGGGGDEPKAPTPTYVPPPAPVPSHTAVATPPKQDPPKQDPPKVEDKPDPAQTDDKSSQVSTSVNLTTSNPWNFTRSATNSTASGNVIPTTVSVTPNTAAMSKGYLPTAYGQAQGASAYETGGNLDIVSQLIISFGSLTAASASHAIQGP